MHTKVKDRLEEDLSFLQQKLNDDSYRQVVEQLMKLKHTSPDSDEMASWSDLYYVINDMVHLSANQDLSEKVSDIAFLLRGDHNIYGDPDVIPNFSTQQEDVYQYLSQLLGE